MRFLVSYDCFFIPLSPFFLKNICYLDFFFYICGGEYCIYTLAKAFSHQASGKKTGKLSTKNSF